MLRLLFTAVLTFVCLTSGEALLAADAPPFVGETYAEGDFRLVDGDVLADIYVHEGDRTVVNIAAGLLAEDVERVTGRKPAVKHDPAELGGTAVLIGTLGNSPAIDRLAEEGLIDVDDVRGQWETFVIQTVDDPGLAGVERALVIAGSDRRGTAFGVFELSEQIGVSPWYWWADVPATQREALVIKAGTYQVGPPSVKYRGIFINDEGWGLRAWAARTFDPEFGNIGPKTYEKVFELLLRLKGNYLWPAMHPGTVEFGSVERNVTLAHEWAIVMGAAHCEPLNRNNVWWHQDGEGEWRYDTNRENMMAYWEEWAEKRGAFDAVWTVGMRGLHDTPMQGPETIEGQVALLEQAIADQRMLLERHVGEPAEKIPQVFMPYKEALAHYQAGLDLDDDITIVWAEDNYGYIRQLSSPEEQQRSGGSGVYYHISYLGWPRPYLWLNTTPPALIWSEMTKAYDYGADEIWVVNVGDIKPGEIGIEFWQRLAWDIDRYDTDAQRVFLEEWAAREFGEAHAQEIAGIMDDYYQLGFQRKPELMDDDLFHVVNYNEAEWRQAQYDALMERADSVKYQLPAEMHDAYFQLVLYPVRISALVSEAFVSADLSRLYAQQGRITANPYALRSREAVRQIEAETDYYNNELAGGKWRHQMLVKGITGNWNVQWPTGGEMVATDQPHMGVAVEGQGVPLVDADVRHEVEGEIVDIAAVDGDADDGWARKRDGDIEFMVIPVGVGNELEPGAGDRVRYEFTIPRTGHYNLFMLINCPTDKEDSWFLRLNDGDWMTWNNIGTRAEWDWRRQGTYQLEEGTHTLTIAHREDGAMFSRIRFTEKPWAQPLEELFPSEQVNVLPALDPQVHTRRFVDVYSTSNEPFTFEAEADADWIQLSETRGTVDGQHRLWIEVDWDRVPAGEDVAGEVTLHGAGTTRTVQVPVATAAPEQGEGVFVETNGYVSMDAADFTRSRAGEDGAEWTVIHRLGRTGDAVTPFPVTTRSLEEVEAIMAEAPVMEYDVFVTNPGDVAISAYMLPTHRIHEGRGLRYAISINDETPTIVDYYEDGGRSGEHSPRWRSNVSRNTSVNVTQHRIDEAGVHTVKVWMVDPGVVVDKLVLDTGGLKPSELGPPSSARITADGSSSQ